MQAPVIPLDPISNRPRPLLGIVIIKRETVLRPLVLGILMSALWAVERFKINGKYNGEYEGKRKSK